MIKKEIETFQKRVRSELYENIIPFWQKYTVDNEFGGFTGYIGPDLKIDKHAGKGLILNARILWAFAAIYRFDNKPEYLKLAKRAYDYLNEYFQDKQFGGVFWMVDYQGQCVDDSKKIYGQAFYIYALAEYYLATKDAGALARANEMFELIETNSFDKANTGYFEICNRDWTVAEGARLSDKDMNESKSMNNHLHVIESYTNLYRCERNKKVAEKILGLIDNFTKHIIDRKTFHFNHFFDELWRPKSDSYTFGHDIEGSWLLYEAAEILDKPKLKKEVADLAVKMAEVVFKEGLDKDGGLLYEGRPIRLTEFAQGRPFDTAQGRGGPFDSPSSLPSTTLGTGPSTQLRAGTIINSEKQWWPQAEAVVGFLNAYQLCGKEQFFKAALNCWNFIDRCIVDHKGGEWFMKTSRDGTPNLTDPKVSEWKCPYHNTRMCLEVIKRLANNGQVFKSKSK